MSFATCGSSELLGRPLAGLRWQRSLSRLSETSALGRVRPSERVSDIWPVSDLSQRVAFRPLPSGRLDLGLLGNLKCIVDIDAQVPNGAFELAVAKKQLHGS